MHPEMCVMCVWGGGGEETVTSCCFTGFIYACRFQEICVCGPPACKFPINLMITLVHLGFPSCQFESASSRFSHVSVCVCVFSPTAFFHSFHSFTVFHMYFLIRLISFESYMRVSQTQYSKSVCLESICQRHKCRNANVCVLQVRCFRECWQNILSVSQCRSANSTGHPFLCPISRHACADVVVLPLI